MWLRGILTSLTNRCAAPRACRFHSNPHSPCGALTNPDPSNPSDLDLLTFAVFESAFVSISTAYLFGGLAKDRIAARYQRASLTDPLTGVANRRGFFETGKRLLVRARFARQPTALIMFDLDVSRASMTGTDTIPATRC